MSILLIDNDGKALAALQRKLRVTSEVHIALGGPMGLQRMAEEGPFSVVMAECSMPDMDGITFLERVRDKWPDTVRVLMSRLPLDVHEMLRAVNQARIFHVLPNPCAEEMLAAVTAEALDTFDRNTAQSREMRRHHAVFAKANHEIVCWLRADVRDMVSPVLPLLRALSARLGDPNPMLSETALLISVIGLICLPKTLLGKVIHGQDLTEDERLLFSKHPEQAVELFRHLPHLRGVTGILACYANLLTSGLKPCPGKNAEESVGALLLALVMDYRLALYRTTDLREILTGLGISRAGHPARFLRALEEVVLLLDHSEEEVMLDALRPGMIMARPVLGVRDGRDVVLVPEGYEISRTTIVFLRQSARHGTVREPLAVRRTALTRPTDSDTA